MKNYLTILLLLLVIGCGQSDEEAMLSGTYELFAGAEQHEMSWATLSAVELSLGIECDDGECRSFVGDAWSRAKEFTVEVDSHRVILRPSPSPSQDDGDPGPGFWTEHKYKSIEILLNEAGGLGNSATIVVEDTHLFDDVIDTVEAVWTAAVSPAGDDVEMMLVSASGKNLPWEEISIQTKRPVYDLEDSLTLSDAEESSYELNSNSDAAVLAYFKWDDQRSASGVEFQVTLESGAVEAGGRVTEEDVVLNGQMADLGEPESELALYEKPIVSDGDVTQSNDVSQCGTAQCLIVRPTAQWCTEGMGSHPSWVAFWIDASEATELKIELTSNKYTQTKLKLFDIDTGMFITARPLGESDSAIASSSTMSIPTEGASVVGALLTTDIDCFNIPATLDDQLITDVVIQRVWVE